jgi:hypothetical protein
MSPLLLENGNGRPMAVQTIHFGDEGQLATRELLKRFDALHPTRTARVEGLRKQLAALESIDHQYGGSARLPLEDIEELVAATITDVAQMPSAGGDGEIILGVALWAIRHEVEINAVEPVVNALAQRSNGAASKPELAAVFGLMQGLIAHVRMRLEPDLERSNPERPWRTLHVNFAITAIRTEDPEMIGFAFDALDAALPDERGGFYSEALALALAPGISAVVRERIEARHFKWTGP